MLTFRQQKALGPWRSREGGRRGRLLATCPDAQVQTVSTQVRSSQDLPFFVAPFVTLLQGQDGGRQQATWVVQHKLPVPLGSPHHRMQGPAGTSFLPLSLVPGHTVSPPWVRFQPFFFSGTFPLQNRHLKSIKNRT